MTFILQRPALFAVSSVAVALLATSVSARIVYFPSDRQSEEFTDFRLGDLGLTEDDWLIPVQCYGSGCEETEDSGRDSRDGDEVASGEGLNKGFTKKIVKILLHANSTCDERILPEYVVDCLRVYYGWAADAIPDRGEYADIKKALRWAEKKLTAIVSANIDRDAPVILPREGHKKNAKKLPPLRPVKKASRKKVAAQAKAVVQETELVILRSGEDPARRTEHFQEVAAAVDSNLVILRSA